MFFKFETFFSLLSLFIYFLLVLHVPQKFKYRLSCFAFQFVSLAHSLSLSYASINNRFSSRNTKKDEKREGEKNEYPDLNIWTKHKRGQMIKKVFSNKKLGFFFLMEPSLWDYEFMNGKSSSGFISKHVPTKDETFISPACTSFTAAQYKFYCAGALCST